MSTPVRVSRQMLASLWWLIAVMMAAAFVKTSHSALGLIFIASPYAILIGAWFAYRGISDSLERHFVGPQATLTSLHDRVAILATMAFAGIGTAMFMGIVLQKS